MPAQPTRRELQEALGHPLFIGAVALLLCNDHILKAAHPGPWITGKLSDIAWLVVAPLLLAALLCTAGLRTSRARPLALAVPAFAFVLLQLWPPLGDAWVSLFGGAHVADATDLLALPALLAVPLAWRPHRWTLPRSGRRLASVVATGGLMATSYVPDGRTPCADQTDWDPARPLALSWTYAEIPDNPKLLADGVTLRDSTGAVLPFTVSLGTDGLLICPDGGLVPETTYTWRVGGWENLGLHVENVPPFSQTGVWTFTTASESTWTRGCPKPLESVRAFVDSCATDSGAY